MTPLTIAKLTLALIAVILFAYGIHADSNALRYAAIGFLAAAVFLRFVMRGRG
jgi:multisubunit Na+/H+ antiporter MnhF subunit